MASDNEASCVSDPNFAVICSFLECFGKSCGINYPDIASLQQMLEDVHEVGQPLVDLHIKLLRKARKTVSPEKWERSLVKFCHTYSNQDGWELERFGYKKARIGVKLRLLKVLLETQFDLNARFKLEVNKLAAEQLRVQPLGRDKTGLAYWFHSDDECNIRVYREDLDEENWELVASDREGVVSLINCLSDGEAEPLPLNEDDSNSLEISEKPIIDTGQPDESSSPDDDSPIVDDVSNVPKNDKEIEKISTNIIAIKNVIDVENSNKQINKTNVDDDVDDEEDEDDEDDDEEEEDEEEEEEEEVVADDDEGEVSNEGSSKQNSEDDDDQEDEEDDEEEEEDDNEDDDSQEASKNSNVSVSHLVTSSKIMENIVPPVFLKAKIPTIDRQSTWKPPNDLSTIRSPKISTPKRNLPEPPVVVKAIETPVITTSPIKLVNIQDLQQQSIEDRSPRDEKYSSKSILSFKSVDSVINHNKFPIKPIDKLAENLSRIQSEKFEKPGAAKLLEKIAQNLARTSTAQGTIVNSEDDKSQQDFTTRKHVEKSNVGVIGTSSRTQRLMDLSTSPRDWDNSNDRSRPMDYSGIDLSSRKIKKTSCDITQSSYRTTDFQHREIDLSTKKSLKPELLNHNYDHRGVILRNQSMVTDLSKKQIYPGYEVNAASGYHVNSRLTNKEDLRLPNYTILPDPSKIAGMRMAGVSGMKRSLEMVDDPQQDMIKRMRNDGIAIRAPIDKRSVTMTGNTLRRGEIGTAIEEPVMMVHGEGSGSDCDAVNPDYGETIEEPILFFYGNGAGNDCDTGNPGDDNSSDNNDGNESKKEGCTDVTTTVEPSKSLNDDGENNTDHTENVVVVPNSSVKTNPNFSQSNVVNLTIDNCQSTVVSSVTTKSKFIPTLGVQVIARTTGGIGKKSSRWDVGRPDETNEECDSSIINADNDDETFVEANPTIDDYDNEKIVKTKIVDDDNDDEIKFKEDVITSTSNQIYSNEKIGECSSTSRINDDGRKLIDVVADQPDSSVTTESANDGKIDKREILMTQISHCDSSIVASSSTDNRQPVESTIDEDNNDRHEESMMKKRDNDNDDPTSYSTAPRFFFGPNCVSYTFKPTDTGSACPTDLSVVERTERENSMVAKNNNNFVKIGDNYNSESSNGSDVINVAKTDKIAETVEKIGNDRDDDDEPDRSELSLTSSIDSRPKDEIDFVATNKSAKPSILETKNDDVTDKIVGTVDVDDDSSIASKKKISDLSETISSEKVAAERDDSKKSVVIPIVTKIDDTNVDKSKISSENIVVMEKFMKPECSGNLTSADRVEDTDQRDNNETKDSNVTIVDSNVNFPIDEDEDDDDDDDDLREIGDSNDRLPIVTSDETRSSTLIDNPEDNNSQTIGTIDDKPDEDRKLEFTSDADEKTKQSCDSEMEDTIARTIENRNDKETNELCSEDAQDGFAKTSKDRDDVDRTLTRNIVETKKSLKLINEKFPIENLPDDSSGDSAEQSLTSLIVNPSGDDSITSDRDVVERSSIPTSVGTFVDDEEMASDGVTELPIVVENPKKSIEDANPVVEKASGSSRLLETLDSYVDDVSENLSSADQDSNEPMVIDDRTSDSNGSARDVNVADDDKSFESKKKIQTIATIVDETVIGNEKVYSEPMESVVSETIAVVENLGEKIEDEDRDDNNDDRRSIGMEIGKAVAAEIAEDTNNDDRPSDERRDEDVKDVEASSSSKVTIVGLGDVREKSDTSVQSSSLVPNYGCSDEDDVNDDFIETAGSETKDIEENFGVDETIAGRDEPIVGRHEPIITEDERIVRSDQTIVQSDEPIVRKDEKIVRKDETIVQKDEPIVQKDEPIVREDDTIVRKDEPMVQKDGPIVQKDERIVQKDEPIVQKDEPIVQKDESIVQKDESIVQKDESIVPKNERIPEKEEPIVRKDEPIIQTDEPIAQKDEPIVHKNQPIVRKDEPIFREDVPIIQKDEPIAHKDEPIVQKDEPIVQKDEPIVQKGEPIVQKDEPIVQMEEPIGQKEEPIVQKDEPIARRDEPIVQKEEPIVQKEEPIVQKEEPIVQKEEPIVQKEEPIVQKDEPMARRDEPIARTDESIVQKEELIVQKEEPIVQKEEPIVQKGEPIVQMEEPIVQRDEPIVQKDEPIVRKDEPIVQKDEPIVQKDEPIVQKDEPIIRKDEPIIQKDEPIIQKDEPIIRMDEPNIRSDEPIVRRDEPIVRRDEPIVQRDDEIIDEQPECHSSKIPERTDAKPISENEPICQSHENPIEKSSKASRDNAKVLSEFDDDDEENDEDTTEKLKIVIAESLKIVERSNATMVNEIPIASVDKTKLGEDEKIVEAKERSTNVANEILEESRDSSSVDDASSIPDDDVAITDEITKKSKTTIVIDDDPTSSKFTSTIRETSEKMQSETKNFDKSDEKSLKKLSPKILKSMEIVKQTKNNDDDNFDSTIDEIMVIEKVPTEIEKSGEKIVTDRTKSTIEDNRENPKSSTIIESDQKIKSIVDVEEIAKTSIKIFDDIADSERSKKIESTIISKYPEITVTNLKINENVKISNEVLTKKSVKSDGSTIVDEKSVNVISTIDDVREIEIVETTTESKKEASKRCHEITDVEDFPPIKSKPSSNVEFTTFNNVDDDENRKIVTNVEPVTIDDDNTNVNVDDNTKIVDVVPPISTDLAPISTDLTSISTSTIPTVDRKNFEKFGNNDVTDLSSTGPRSSIVNEKSGEEKISEIQSVNVKYVDLESDDSMGMGNDEIFGGTIDDVDPLACVNDDDDDAVASADLPIVNDAKIGIRVKPVKDLFYEGWKMDSPDSGTIVVAAAPSTVSRKRRNSNNDVNSDDCRTKNDETMDDDDVEAGGKRMKLRGKRSPDVKLRKSVEQERRKSASSEDERTMNNPTSDDVVIIEEIGDSTIVAEKIMSDRKPRGRPRGKRRRGNRMGGRMPRPLPPTDATPVVVPDVATGDADVAVVAVAEDDSSVAGQTEIKKKRKKRKMVLGLEIGIDILVPESQTAGGRDEIPVRQSRRIAQLKIKEEADKRRIEEETLDDPKEKKDRDGSEKKKRKKQKPETEEEPEVITKEIERVVKTKKKRKKKKLSSKFNEAKPWQSSSGTSTEEEGQDDDDDDDMESEGSLLFKSDHEFSPESDLEKENDESEPMRRARTARKSQSDVEEAEDEYACQKCGKADHPEWILLCDTCDKGWHCSCLRPALMLIPEGDWFCPPCQHIVLVNKLRESLKTFDQNSKRHENEVLRKKRLAYVGISLDNVLHKREGGMNDNSSRGSSRGSESSSSSSESSSSSSSSDDSEPVYQLRERRCANTYKFNEYDDMINAAIGDEVEAIRGAGNQGRGKDIATIVNAEKEEAEAEALKNRRLDDDDEDDNNDAKKESDEDYKIDKDEIDDDDDDGGAGGGGGGGRRKKIVRKSLSRKKHRKLNSLDISSEDDPDSDEDFKGSGSDEDDDFDDQESTDDSYAQSRRRGRKGEARPVRRSTRNARKTRYDREFINDSDDTDDSDRPKRKKSRSVWEGSDSEDSDNSWRQRKKRSKAVPTRRFRPKSRPKSTKKKKRKRIIEPENVSDNEEPEAEAEGEVEDETETKNEEIDEAGEDEPTISQTDPTNEIENIVTDENRDIENLDKNEKCETPVDDDERPKKKKKDSTPKQKKAPGIRRKIVYGGLDDDGPRQEEETLARRTRGRKINYQDIMGSDSEEELKKVLRKTEESEDEFVVNEGEEVNEDVEKDSDSGDIYSPKKELPKGKAKSPKAKKPKKSKSPGVRKSLTDNGTPKERKKPGPKPGSKNRPRQTSLSLTPVAKSKDGDSITRGMDMEGSTMSATGSVIGEVPEGSLTGLTTDDINALDDEQLEQMMMEDEEYGRRQLELAAIEIARNKKQEDREAKKLEKARLKALEILAAEQQRDTNVVEGPDGDVPKKKKRGRRSKAEILAEQMRRDGLTSVLPIAMNHPNVSSDVNLIGKISTTLSSPDLTPTTSNLLPTSLQTIDVDRSPDCQMPIIPIVSTDGQQQQQQQQQQHQQHQQQQQQQQQHQIQQHQQLHQHHHQQQQLQQQHQQQQQLQQQQQQQQLHHHHQQLYTPDSSPTKPKRRGRGKGKKTLALEAARAAEAAARPTFDYKIIPVEYPGNVNVKLTDLKNEDIPNVIPTPGSSTSGSAPSTPPSSVCGSQGIQSSSMSPNRHQPTASQQPTATSQQSSTTPQIPQSSQQPSPSSNTVYPSLQSGQQQQQSSVITRMLQSQSQSTVAPQSFTAAAAAMGHKYFGPGSTAGNQVIGTSRGGNYEMTARGRIPSPYRQSVQAPTSMPPHFAAVRSVTPPMRMRPQLYHTGHHPMDPSPSGGGPISINNRDRSSPHGSGSSLITATTSVGVSLAKGGPTPPPQVTSTPPPPPPPPPPPGYVRTGVTGLSRFNDSTTALNSRLQLSSFGTGVATNHGLQQQQQQQQSSSSSSPTANRTSGNFSPYHPPPPPNYHYGAYPPPPPMTTADDAAAYQGSPYTAEHFTTPGDGQQQQQQQQQQQSQSVAQSQSVVTGQSHVNDNTSTVNKQYDEEGSGEFGGLVSYFSSQREDDLDS